MLTDSNYFSPENQLKYMGSSQYKSFLKCEESALAEIKDATYIEKVNILVAKREAEAMMAHGIV